MKPIGSEKLTGMEKIQRIIEIAQYGTTNQNVNESTTEYAKKAVDGNTYAIVKEKDGYYVKVGLNESSLDYVDGMLNKNKNRFTSYAGALKKINLMIKPLNETLNDGKEDPVLNETKYVLKKPAAAPVEEPVMDTPAPTTEPESGDEDEFDFSSLDLGGDSEETEMDAEIDMEMDTEMDSEMSDEEPSEEPSKDEEGGKLKKVQKLTGKLGQALRDMKVDLESSDIKYVLNSVISAIDLEKLSPEDLEDVMTNFEELEDFEISSEEGEDSDELAIDDMDLGLEDMEGESSDEEELEEDITFSDSIEDDVEDYRPMSDREGQDFDMDIDGMEGDLDEGAFLKGLSSLGGKFVNYYKNNPEARKMINDLGASAVSKGSDKIASELDKSEKLDKEGKASSTLKGFNPSEKDIDTIGNLIFGDLNEDEVSTKIDNVLGKYFK